MTSDFPTDPRQALEASLTAMLLGELPEDQAAFLRQAIASDPELARMHERLKVTIGLVRETAATPMPATETQATPLRMSAEKREALLQRFKTIEPKEFKPRRTARRLVVELAVAACLVGVLGIVLLPTLSRSKSRSMSSLGRLHLTRYELTENAPAAAPDRDGSQKVIAAPLPQAVAKSEERLRRIEPNNPAGGTPNKPAQTTIVLPAANELADISPAAQPQGAVKEALGAFPPKDSSSMTLIGGTAPVVASDSTALAFRAPTTGASSDHALKVPEPVQSIVQEQPLAQAVEPSAQMFQPVPARALPAQSQPEFKGTPVETPGQSVFRERYGLAPGSSGAATPSTVAGVNHGALRGGVVDQNTGLPISPPSDTVYPNGGFSGGTAGAQFGMAAAKAAPIDPNTGLPITSGNAGNLGLASAREPEAGEWNVTATLRGFSPDTNASGFGGGGGGLAAGDLGGTQPSSAGPLLTFDDNRGAADRLSEDKAKVPMLGDLPVGGRFFRLESNIALPKVESESSSYNRTSAYRTLSQLSVAETAGLTALNYQNEVTSNKAEGREAGQSAGSNFYSINGAGYANVAALVPTDSTFTFTTGGVLPTSAGAKQELASAEKNLEERKQFATALKMKLNSESIDLDVPKNSMVAVIDRATPDQKPTVGEKIRSALGGGVTRSARVKIERDQPDIAGMATPGRIVAYDPYFVQNEFETIQSDKVLGQVVDRLHLDEEFAKKKGASVTKEQAVAMLKKDLDLKSVKGTSQIEIGAKSKSPEEAAKIANAIADAYGNYRLEQRKQLTVGGVEALRERLGTESARISEAESNVDRMRLAFKISDALASSDTPTPMLSGEALRKLMGLRIDAEAELVGQETLLQKLKDLKESELVQSLPTTGISDPTLAAYLEQLNLAKQKQSTLKRDFGPNYTEVTKLNEQIADLQAKIKDRAAGIVLGMDAKVGAMRQRLADLKSEVEAMQVDLAKANETRPYWEEKRKLEELQRIRAVLLAQIAAEEGKLRKDTNQPAVADEALKRTPSGPLPEPQPEINTRENAFSTFSMNVSDVSFKLAAASLEKGVLPDPASIRSEEFINAFDYRDPEAPAGAPVAFAWERGQYPFAQGRDLLRFSIKTTAQGRQPGRPLNLVLLLDNSGSMERADRVQIIHEALRVLAAQLSPQDVLSVVTFARTPRLWLDGVPGSAATNVAEEVSGLTPEGGTNLGDALELAYQTARRHYLAAGINRVVLLTDGAANLGDVDPDSLKKKVESNRKQGIALDCFGIGWEGYNDDLLETLTRNADGRYGFLNTPEEAATGFAGQLAGALNVAASDVKVQVEFNPNRVTEYRQIGYAKLQLTKEQFRDNTVNAAPIGAAETGNALYVIDVNGGGDGPLATVRVRYRVPGTQDYREQEWTVPYTGTAVPLPQSGPALRLAATASAFSEWLATSPYAGEVTPDRLLGYLSGVPEVYGADPKPKKLEWMIRQAKSLAGK